MQQLENYGCMQSLVRSEASPTAQYLNFANNETVFAKTT